MSEVDNEVQMRKVNDEASRGRRRGQLQYEGGEIELTKGNPPPPSPSQVPAGTEVPAQDNDTQSSIDTNLFLDEKKELIEFSNFTNRLFVGFIAFALNLGIIVAVIALFIKEGYYNQDNNYVWVVSFFGSQLIGLFLYAPLALFFLARVATKRANKARLARYFRDALYIYEDYQFVVKFAKTKIS